MKLRAKMMSIALLPVFILGIGTFLLAADRIADGIYDEACKGMQAASLAVRDIFEVGNPGKYNIDENGDLWKGETLNISQSSEIADHIKDNTGMDVTIYWDDTRILTSIKNSSGERQIQTKAPAAVIQKVLKNGEYYFDRQTEIFDTEYIVCYAPFFQEGTDQPVGMVFLGKPRMVVARLINEIRLQMLAVISAVLVLTGIIVTILVKRINNALAGSMELLRQIADGDLTVQIDPFLLNRSDELGMLGREIMLMGSKLRTIANMLHEKSRQLDHSSSELHEHSGTILHLMKGLDQSAREMSAGCTSLAEDACEAGNDVSSMGEMIEQSNADIKKMYEISSQIQDMSRQTMDEILQLNKDMARVRTSIDDLDTQTALTKESADRIKTATDLIAAVASQTNLLSLNASIEAARAGDLGRGFGVVASEIQNLSVQANEAVEDIRTMVESLTRNSDHTIHRMAEVRSFIENQGIHIEKTGQVFEQVKNGITDSVDYMNHVISRSEHMEDVRINMIGAVQNAAAMAQENAASIQEVTASLINAYEEIQILSDRTDELDSLSTQMKESVSVFSIDCA
ncbi:MAG: methyl-accepting chemotaxis protein [Eubacterium sp.]|nr:methyl-accepting chemotaxis protein [Eubacterium sp.]